MSILLIIFFVGEGFEKPIYAPSIAQILMISQSVSFLCNRSPIGVIRDFRTFLEIS